MLSIILSLICAFSTAMDVRTLDGRTLRGTVVELSDKQLGVQTSEGLVALKTDELLSISFSGGLR